MNNVKKLAYLALFIALSVVGAMIKIPSTLGTVAFDSLPGFVAAVILGPLAGAVVGALGHLASAATAGFPFGLPGHLLVAIDMALTMIAYGYFYKKNKIVACVIAVIINAPIGLLPFGFMLGWGFYIGSILILTLGAVLNVVIATVLLKYIKGFVMKNE